MLLNFHKCTDHSNQLSKSGSKPTLPCTNIQAINGDNTFQAFDEQKKKEVN